MEDNEDQKAMSMSERIAQVNQERKENTEPVPSVSLEPFPEPKNPLSTMDDLEDGSEENPDNVKATGANETGAKEDGSTSPHDKSSTGGSRQASAHEQVRSSHAAQKGTI